METDKEYNEVLSGVNGMQDIFLKEMTDLICILVSGLNNKKRLSSLST